MILGKVAYHIIGRMIFEEGILGKRHMIFESRLFFRNDRISQWKTHHRSSCFIENFWDSNLWQSNRRHTYNWS